MIRLASSLILRSDLYGSGDVIAKNIEAVKAVSWPISPVLFGDNGPTMLKPERPYQRKGCILSRESLYLHTKSLAIRTF